MSRLVTAGMVALAHGTWRRWLWPAVAVLLVAAVALGVSDDALARVGGGQNFSTGGGGRSSGGGFGGGGGGGGGDGGGDLIFLLIWLCIEYPAIGIPVAVIVVVVVATRFFMRGGRRGRTVSRTHHYDDGWEEPQVVRPRTTPGLDAVREADPAFSLPVLLDFLQLLHRRATEAAVTRRWEALLPFVSAQARTDLETAHQDVDEVRDVVAGGIQILRVERGRGVFTLQVVFQDTRREQLGDRSRHVYVEETWSLSRAEGARSAAPDEVVRMGCPSCGAAIDTDREGRCRVCSTPIVDGLLQWRAERIAFTARREVRPPQVGWTTGGDEPSVHAPTVTDPDLGRAWRDFRGRHAAFDGARFQSRVEGIYLELQRAWSDGDWDEARPYVTDTLYQTLRFYLEQYTEHDLRNRLGDVRLLRQEIVRVQIDAWYEAITVRIWGQMKDWVETTDGKVVGGNPKQDRRFSEYWTFLRAVGTGDESHDAKQCPSCGAPLDRVSQAGICGYCESKITTGQFDWVLSRIDQPEVYRG